MRLQTSGQREMGCREREETERGGEKWEREEGRIVRDGEGGTEADRDTHKERESADTQKGPN